MNHPLPRKICRGTMLIQLMITIALTTLLLNLTVMIFRNIWQVENAAALADRQTKALGQLTDLLARDLETADEVNITRKFMLLDKHTLWRLGEEKIVRKTETQEQKFDVGDLDLTLTPTNYGVLLKVENKQGRISRIPLIKSRKWTYQAVNQ